MDAHANLAIRVKKNKIEEKKKNQPDNPCPAAIVLA
jgi:hypothetical protein